MSVKTENINICSREQRRSMYIGHLSSLARVKTIKPASPERQRGPLWIELNEVVGPFLCIIIANIPYYYSKHSTDADHVTL